MKMLLTLLLLIVSLHAEELAVVTSADLEVPTLDATGVERLFLAKTNRLGNVNVKVAELNQEGVKERFYGHISGKTPSQLRAYWTKLIFTGKAQPPRQVDDIDALRKMLKEVPNVITYVPLDQVDASMRILYTLKD